MKPELIIALVVIGLLVAIFFISFILNKKTPIPKECLDLKIDDNKCNSCSVIACPLHKKEGENK